MSKLKSLSLVNTIGVILVIVAVVSAGGLYYTASTYSRISETFVTVDVSVPNLNITLDNATGTVTVTASILVDNPSTLDIEVYRVEYNTYMDRSSATITEYDKYVGGGSIGGKNGTVPADSMKEILVSFSIQSDTVSMSRFLYAYDYSDVTTMLSGYVWYRISDYQEASNRLDFFYFSEVDVYVI